jgi:hypothetical protein
MLEDVDQLSGEGGAPLSLNDFRYEKVSAAHPRLPLLLHGISLSPTGTRKRRVGKSLSCEPPRYWLAIRSQSNEEKGSCSPKPSEHDHQ